MKKSITKEEINDLPSTHFDGEIHVIDHPDQVQPAVEYLEQHDIIGFDTEARPSFKKGHNNKVALLQLATEKHAFLFRLNKIGLHQDAANLLANENIIKVGVGIKDDLRALNGLRHFAAQGFIDLQHYVAYYGIENYSLRKLSAIVLNIRISKRQQLSNWESDRLKPGQLLYAATDAWASLKIYKRLKQRNGTMIN